MTDVSHESERLCQFLLRLRIGRSDVLDLASLLSDLIAAPLHVLDCFEAHLTRLFKLLVLLAQRAFHLINSSFVLAGHSALFELHSVLQLKEILPQSLILLSQFLPFGPVMIPLRRLQHTTLDL